MHTPRELKALYAKGANISKQLREDYGLDKNSMEIIEIAYDLQTGSYIDRMKNIDATKYAEQYTSEIAKYILTLCEPETLLEAGVGEATTLAGVAGNLPMMRNCYGFDLSWSRVAYASTWLKEKGISNGSLCTGDLLNIPFRDSSIDVVYTSHSIEPNGGNEEAILKELFRVTKKYLILLEPAYELASEEAKKRMDSHGYCKGLEKTCLSLGLKVLEHKLFPMSANPQNPTAITIIEKLDATHKDGSSVFACPKYKTPLKEIDGALFSGEALIAYPILNNIPCLRIESGIFASKYAEVSEKLKKLS